MANELFFLIVLSSSVSFGTAFSAGKLESCGRASDHELINF